MRRQLLPRVIATIATLGAVAVAPAGAAKPAPRPHPVDLRLGSVHQQPRLIAPGMAMSRAQRRLPPGGSITLRSEPLRRPVRITGTPWVRLHLTHDAPGDVKLYIQLQAATVEGSTRTLVGPTAITAPAAKLEAGPAADVDGWLPRVEATVQPGETLLMTISELGPLGDVPKPDSMTLYFGALPGEATDPNDTREIDKASRGGADPARIVLPAIGEGPFQAW